MVSKAERDWKRRDRRKRDKCSVCHETIVGKKWRMGGEKFACTRCASQTSG